ncbi:MAG: hypothetical protein ACRDA5_14070 [Clostridium sp.]
MGMDERVLLNSILKNLIISTNCIYIIPILYIQLKKLLVDRD